MAPQERSAHVAWALGMLQGDWFAPIVEERTRAIGEAHHRLRAMVKAASLTVTPHTPPDVMACYVLVPAGGPR
jgi:hypothetical protein